MSAVAEAPRWDLTPFFPSLQSPEFAAAFAEIDHRVSSLEALLDELGVRIGALTLDPAEAALVFESVAPQWNDVADGYRLVSAFLYGLVTTDSRDEAAQAQLSELEPIGARLGRLGTRLTGWLGAQDEAGLLAASPLAAQHAFMIRKARISAEHLLTGPEEALASELSLTGSTAWSKLHGNVSSQLEVAVDLPTGRETLPMSAVRNLAYDPSEAVREAGYRAELAAWATQGTVMAACLNGVKGEAGLLSRKRGWASPLDQAVFGANIDRPTLDAMLAAAREAFPTFRRYLRAKASRVQGSPGGLKWWNLFAPLGEDGRAWPYPEAEAFVEECFRQYSDTLGDFAARTFRERWIDAAPRPGKRDGAYCMGLRGDESRIMMNYKPAFGSVSTLAHELGHAYHNVCLAPRTNLQNSTPMTLAETASIFCETIVRQAALERGTAAERLEILEASLQGSTQVVVDITSRFLFEDAVFTRRAERELSARELDDLMLDAQAQTYGDGLDPEARHPAMWAVKPHYYGRGYYNFPYMYGLLFALGLYHRYTQDPTAFRGQYDDLLSSTGLADAADLGQRFGIQVRDIEFWRGSLAVIAQEVDQFEAALR